MYRHIGDKIRALREIKKHSQANIAESLGITYQTYQYHEKSGNFDSHKLIKIAKYLEVDFNTIFDLNTPADEIMKIRPIQSTLSEVHVYYGDVPPEGIDKNAFEFVPIHETKAAATPAVMDIANGNIDGWACVPSEVLRASCKTEAFRVIGDSMYPNLQDGDIVGVCIFDMPPDLDNLDPDIIYFCQIDNDYDIGYTLKRAKVANNRYLTLIPENKKHDVMILDLWEEKGYSPIIGRVVWIWREL